MECFCIGSAPPKRDRYIILRPLESSNIYLIFSYGNGSSVESVREMGIEISRRFSINVVLYDYPGFGERWRECGSEKKSIRTLRRVHHHLQRRFGEERSSSSPIVFFFGYSIGAIITLKYLSHRTDYDGVCILNPIEGFLSVACVGYCCCCCGSYTPGRRWCYDLWCGWRGGCCSRCECFSLKSYATGVVITAPLTIISSTRDHLVGDDQFDSVCARVVCTRITISRIKSGHTPESDEEITAFFRAFGRWVERVV